MSKTLVSSWGPRLFVMGVLTISNVLANCSQSLSEPDLVAGSFVGSIADTDIFVTLVTNGTDVRAYVCDGLPDREVSVAEWFKGTYSNNALDLASASGAARMVAGFTLSAATGRIEMVGRAPLTFTAFPADAPFGLYAYKNVHAGQQYQAGWIVMPSGDQRGSMTDPTRTSIGVSLNLSGGTAQLPGIGTVTVGPVTKTNLIGFQFGGWPPFGTIENQVW